MASREAQSTEREGPVDRAFRVLQIVVAAGEPLGVREIGRRSGLPRSTAARLVSQLERLRMIDRTSPGEIIPGSALVTLQPSASVMPLLSDRLRPLLVEMAKTFGEDAALAIDDGDALLYVAHAPSENAVSVDDVTGQRHAFHHVAPGLVAMSMWDDARLVAHLKNELVAATDKSMTDARQLRQRLGQIKRDGFGWAEEELDLGINGLAVPVRLDDRVAGFVSLYGPSYRFARQLRSSLATELLELVDLRLG